MHQTHSPCAGLPWVRRFEDGIQLFQGDGFRLDIEEVDEHELKQVPENEEDVEPVADLQNFS